MTMEYLKLNNGVEMPKVGLGTFLIPGERLSETIGEAYRLGYRKFDTAWRYHNERQISEALKENGIKREDVFITTKVNPDAFCYFGFHNGKRRFLNSIRSRSIASAIEESFENLQTDYIDLFLVHYPYPMYREMYKVLTKFYKIGKIKAIGVCSCLPSHIEALREVSDVQPAVNQFEISPINTQKSLIKYCHENDIVVEAMSTFSHFRSNEPRLEIVENQAIRPIAVKYGKSIVQVILRWLIQQDIAVIPKTWDFSHLAENISLFDFTISEEDMTLIDTLDEGHFLNYNPYPTLKYLPKKYRMK